jgi:hypothetical protein
MTLKTLLWTAGLVLVTPLLAVVSYSVYAAARTRNLAENFFRAARVEEEEETMRRLPTITASLVLLIFASAESSTTQGKPPKEVLIEFVKAELDGARLTSEGWKKTSRFFVRSGSPPYQTIFVVTCPRCRL